MRQTLLVVSLLTAVLLVGLAWADGAKPWERQGTKAGEVARCRIDGKTWVLTDEEIREESQG